jgi:hypothetical protein
MEQSILPSVGSIQEADLQSFSTAHYQAGKGLEAGVITPAAMIDLINVAAPMMGTLAAALAP